MMLALRTDSTLYRFSTKKDLASQFTVYFLIFLPFWVLKVQFILRPKNAIARETQKLRNSIAKRLCRLGDLYREQGEASYADILLSSRVRLDNWSENDNRDGAFGGFRTDSISFDVTVLIARHYLKALSVDEERDFKDTVKYDLIENIVPKKLHSKTYFSKLTKTRHPFNNRTVLPHCRDWMSNS